jgi:hypothetical protein
LDTFEAIVKKSGAHVVAILGVSKNAGKTTTLCHLANGLKERVGLLSIGIDGEELDFWLGAPKPRIFVRAQSLIATAEGMIKGGATKARILHRSGVTTPLGELVVARVEEDGFVVLAGVRHKDDVKNIIAQIDRHKVERILIDGSYHRAMAADPEVSQGVVLVTGAIVGKTCEEVAEKTKFALERLLIPETNDDEERLLATNVFLDRCIIVKNKGKALEKTFSMFEADRLQVEKGALVFVGGVLTDGLLNAFGSVEGVKVFVYDPTRVFLSKEALDRFSRNGGTICARKGIKVLAVAINPKSILGYELDAAELKDRVEEIAFGIPCFIVREGVFGNMAV